MLYFNLGLLAVIVPTLYALGMVLAWCAIRNKLARRLTLIALAIVGALVPVRMAREWHTDHVRGQALAEYCKQHTDPEILAHVVADDAFYIDADRYAVPDKDSSAVGATLFPDYLATRLLLGGVNRYSEVAFRVGSGYEVATVAADGAIKSTRIMQPPHFKYGLRWENGVVDDGNGIASATAVVRNLETGQILARQTVFLLATGGRKAFPSPFIAPTYVKPLNIEMCPRPAEIARFLKSVVNPD